MRKPTLCGSNRLNLPESGCSDCAELEYRIKQLEDWKEEFVEEGYNALANKPTINGVTVEGDKTSEDYLITPISEDNIIALTPMECYVPACEDSRACFGEACCMKVGQNTNPSSTVCEGGICYAKVACEEPENPSLEASIECTSITDETVELQYSVTNVGNVAIENVTLTSDIFGALVTTPLLNVGATEDATQQYAITEDDKTEGSVSFSALAEGTYNDEPITTSSAITVELPLEEPSETSE